MPAGRPTDYRPEFVGQAEKLSSLGATDSELADFFGVNVSTLNLWKIKYPEFSASIKMSKEEADSRVVRSLYQRAMGNDKIPADTTACIFWLKNRKSAEWRDKQDHGFDSQEPLTIRIIGGKTE